MKLKKVIKKIIWPFKWIITKIGQGLSFVFYENYNKIFIVIIPSVIFALLGGSILLYSFKNINEDTTYLTNYGFAILIGLSSVCFSWTRNLDNEKEPLMLRTASASAEGFLHCAIIFLLSSIIKYGTLKIDILFGEEYNVVKTIIISILSILYGISFTLGFFKAERNLYYINLMLYERQHLNKKK